MDIIVKPNTTLNNKTGAWRTLKPNFLHEKCTACAICSRVCPEGVAYQTDRLNSAGKKYYDCDYNYCKGCSLCATECPFRAIEMEVEQK